MIDQYCSLLLIEHLLVATSQQNHEKSMDPEVVQFRCRLIRQHPHSSTKKHYGSSLVLVSLYKISLGVSLSIQRCIVNAHLLNQILLNPQL
jgi:hypothetical protein